MIKTFEEGIRWALKNQAVLKEVFSLEQLAPHFDWNEETKTATITERLRLRLTEISDYKQRVRDAIKEWNISKNPNRILLNKIGFENDLSL